MQAKIAALLLTAVAATALVGCSKETPTASQPSVQSAPAGPRVEVAPEHHARLEAAGKALRELVEQSKKTKDLAKLTPYIERYTKARNALVDQMPDNAQRMAGFRDLMQKNVVTREDRASYSAAMSAYHKAKAPVAAPKK